MSAWLYLLVVYATCGALAGARVAIFIRDNQDVTAAILQEKAREMVDRFERLGIDVGDMSAKATREQMVLAQKRAELAAIVLYTVLWPLYLVKTLRAAYGAWQERERDES